MPKERISIIGTGYVGLCTAVAFASRGYKVITSTQDSEKAKSINEGIPPFYEPDLQESLQKVVNDCNLRCSMNREETVLNTDVTFIAVGTPSRADGSIDLQFIKSASREIGEALRKKDDYHLIVVKSTVIPGTSENVVKPAVEKYSNKRCGTHLGLCMNPEFLREGSALYDSFYPDRVIIGEYDKKSGDVLETLFKEFYGKDAPPFVRANLSSAEMIKYANNAFLAAKVSFINTIANICEEIPGADVTTVARGIGLDRRIGPLFLNAGLGYGGSCFPKDVKALIAYSKSLGYTPVLLDAIEEVNKVQPYKAVELVRNLLGEDLKSKRIAILGLAFKPNTNDMREAVSVKIIRNLLEAHADIVAYDSAAIPDAREVFSDKIEYASSVTECLHNADCCIIVTEWDEFKRLEPEDFIENMRNPILIDGRRIYDPKKFREKLRYVGIGLGDFNLTSAFSRSQKTSITSEE